jgi:hypothetical protein
MKKVLFTMDEVWAIINALHVAANQYEQDAKAVIDINPTMRRGSSPTSGYSPRRTLGSRRKYISSEDRGIR